MLKNILIIDDEDILRMLAPPLEEEGYSVHTALNGEAGLLIIQSQPIDVVFLGDTLSRDNGLVILDKIKTTHPDIFIIMVTAYEELDLVVTAIKAGAYDLLPKPFKLAGVKAILEKIKKASADKRELSYLKEKVKAYPYGEMLEENSSIQVNSAPLRERNGDLQRLIEHFIIKFNKELGKNIVGLTAEAKSLLGSYTFPGDVRELKNIIERAVLLAEKTEITPELLPESVRGNAPKLKIDTSLDIVTFKKQNNDEVEKEYIIGLLKGCKGNVTRSSEKAGIRRTSLLRLMKKHGIFSKFFKVS